MPDINGKPVTILAHCFLLEHETYSDEAPCLIVGENGALLYRTESSHRPLAWVVISINGEGQVNTYQGKDCNTEASGRVRR